jgi:hypothetical protein
MFSFQRVSITKKLSGQALTSYGNTIAYGLNHHCNMQIQTFINEYPQGITPWALNPKFF